MSEKNKRYSATQINAELFWKFPKFLLENKKYETLSNDARVAYMLIKDMKISALCPKVWT